MKRLTIVLILVMIAVLSIPLNATISSEFNQTTRLAVTAKVWGFLKYYHPAATSNNVDMDQVLIHALPKIMNADTQASFNQALQEMIFNSGKINVFSFPSDTQHVPLLDWMGSTPQLNMSTLFLLKKIKSFHIPGESYYVTYDSAVKNPAFGNEKLYFELGTYPAMEYRLIALFRYWNVIDYFYPYKNVIGEDWDNVLVEYIPRMIEAGDALSYHLAVREFTARINDNHAGMGSTVLNDYLGLCMCPFTLAYVENQTIIGSIDHRMALGGDIQVGDIIEKMDGVPITELRNGLLKYVPHCNEGSMQNYINNYLERGRDKDVTLTLRRDNREITTTVYRYDYAEFPKETVPVQSERWRMLDGNIGYVNMKYLGFQNTTETKNDVANAMTEFANTRAIIFDVRNYPEFILYSICNYLNPTAIPFVKFNRLDLTYPGKFYEDAERAEAGQVGGNSNYYKGQVIILFNSETLSRAEFTCMAFQTAPNAISIGSPTAGSDGNISYLSLPGNITVVFTGLGVYYPDGRPTQRVGLQPDIYVTPTIEGIRQGRDEVLEKALEFMNNQ